LYTSLPTILKGLDRVPLCIREVRKVFRFFVFPIFRDVVPVVSAVPDVAVNEIGEEVAEEVGSLEALFVTG
jgi:hypothetical protein